jgi:hypothetical protein
MAPTHAARNAEESHPKKSDRAGASRLDRFEQRSTRLAAKPRGS